MKIEKIISYLFHPVLFSTISAILYFTIQPQYLPKPFEYKVLLVVFVSTYVIPILFLFILKQRKSIDDFHLNTTQERKIPILFFITISLLLSYRLFEIKIVSLLSYFFFGSAFSMLIVFILLFSKLKVSLHTLSIGNLIGFIIIMSFHYKIRLLLLLSFLFIIFGVIAYARLKLKAHNNIEIYLGLFFGLLSQLLVYYITSFIC